MYRILFLSRSVVEEGPKSRTQNLTKVVYLQGGLGKEHKISTWQGTKGEEKYKNTNNTTNTKLGKTKHTQQWGKH